MDDELNALQRKDLQELYNKLMKSAEKVDELNSLYNNLGQVNVHSLSTKQAVDFSIKCMFIREKLDDAKKEYSDLFTAYYAQAKALNCINF